MLGLIEREYGLRCESVVFNEESPSFKDGKENFHYVRQHRSSDHSLRDNFSGNPLELEEIVNLSLESKLIVEPDRKQVPSSQFIDFSSMKPLKSIPADAYLDAHLYCISGLGGISAADYQLFGVFKLTSFSKRILRIRVVTDPDLCTSIKEVQRVHMAMFSSFSTNFEATYNFPFASLSVQFDISNERLLCPPLSFVTGTLTSEIKPYDSCLLPSILEDFKLLKSIFTAYESDCSVWQTAEEPLTLEMFQSSLPLLFKDTQICDTVPSGGIRSVQPFRHLDSTERLWDAIKIVHSRQTFRGLLNCATHYLLKHRELLKLHRHNHTQLATRLRTLLNSQGPIHLDSSSAFPYGIEYLLEIGLNKLTNDCISVLETAIPDCVSTVDDEASVVELHHRWAQLHHLYKASCLFLSLSPYCSKQVVIREVRAILNTSDPKGEWRVGLFEDPSRGPLVVSHQLSLPLSELLVPLSSIPPSLWIMRMDATEPVRTSVRLVYEHVPTRDESVCSQNNTKQKRLTAGLNAFFSIANNMHLPVTTQPYEPDHRDWVDGLFACRNNRKSCFLIGFCYPCYMCHMYSRYEECCATPMCILFPGLVLRTYHRGKHRIAGTVFRDWVYDCCCPLCAACQLDRDMKHIERSTGELNI